MPFSCILAKIRSSSAAADRAVPRSVVELSARGELWFALILSLAIGVVIRVTEFPLWMTPHLWVGDEPLMVTHDAYAWLAGAKGIGGYVDTWMARGLAALHALTGAPLGVIGFWLPVVVTPLTCVPVCWLAFRLGVPEAGALAGVMAGTSLGFLVRTRIGFCDTDILSLFFPTVVAALCAVWLQGALGERWGGRLRELRHEMVWPVVVGVAGMLSRGFYPQSGTIILAVLGAAALLVAVCGRRELWPQAFLALLAMFCLIYLSPWGVVPAALAVAAMAQTGPRRPQLLWAAVVAAVVAAYFSDFAAVLHDYALRALMFTKNSSVDSASSDTLKLPAVAQSIREAQNLDWLGMMERVAGRPWLFVVSSVGFVAALWRWPVLFVFAPFWGLGMASVWLGNRFAMYGGVPAGIGLAFGVAWGVRRLTSRQGRRWIAQLVLSCFALWPAADLMRQVVPIPVIPKIFAETYLRLQQVTPPNARLWQWWDYGYAAQYFAERMSFGDGGLHDGPWLFPLARVHMTNSPREAAQIMKFVTQSQLAATNGSYVTDPVIGFRRLGPQGTREFLHRLAREDLSWGPLPEQYLVVTWENMRIAGWISFFGHWDVETGLSDPAILQAMVGKTDIDTKAGLLMNSGRTFALERLFFVGPPPRQLAWNAGSGLNAIVNEAANSIHIADNRAFGSMMVQLLIGDPAAAAPYLELVEDRYPWVRVYRVR
ncbi:MAG: undecaprenyl-diphosphooligosaccharide---protein glycotransferase [Desulfomicrobiaceae bacterium]|nr:undecaprenyl-diphosphooligosaccharide---protein glycotransferase [Desulfomicrobiaceae bacterium]